MQLIFTNLLNGVSYASILFLIASGLSLIMGVMGVLNLAHGALYMIGAFIGLTAAVHWNNFLIGAVLATFSLGVFGFMLQQLFLSRLHKQFDEQALLTLGLVYILANTVLWIWGPYSKMGKAPAFLSHSISLGSYAFPVYRFAIIIIALMVFGGLWWLQDNTRAGAQIRAGMDNKVMTMGLGVNYGMASLAVFIMGAAIGGLAGFLGAPIIGADPEMSMGILMLAMIVVVVGGLGSVQGALLGSLIIGILDTFGKTFFPDFAMFTAYIIFIIMLIVRPTGLLGRKKI